MVRRRRRTAKQRREEPLFSHTVEGLRIRFYLAQIGSSLRGNRPIVECQRCGKPGELQWAHAAVVHGNWGKVRHTQVCRRSMMGATGP